MCLFITKQYRQTGEMSKLVIAKSLKMSYLFEDFIFLKSCISHLLLRMCALSRERLVIRVT